MISPRVLLALDFGGTKTAVAVCDEAGGILATATVNGTQAGAGGAPPAREVFTTVVRAARGLLASVAPDSELAAVGAATFGIPFEDRVELAPAIAGWESLALGRELRAAFGGAPVRLATDAKAAAAAEARWGALHGCDPGIYLNLGTGLSAALVVGGQVVAGHDGAAGEIGYNLRSISDVSRPAGQRVLLEDAVSGRGLARQAARLRAGDGARLGSGDGPGPDRGDGPLDAAAVFRLAPRDPGLAGLVGDMLAELAFHLVNLAICVNPERIAAGGGLVRAWDRLGPALTQALAAGVPFPPQLVAAQFPYDAPLRGAAVLAATAAAARHTEPDTLTEGLPQ